MEHSFKMKIPLENGLIREWKKNKRCDVVMENGLENDPENELGSDPDTQRMELAELKRRGEPFEVPRKWWQMNDWTSKRRMAPEKMILDNQIDQLPSEKMLKNFPVQNPFTILGSLDFHVEMKKKMKRPKSEKLHPVLRVNYHCSDNWILGSPIALPGIWNMRCPMIKPNKKVENSKNTEDVLEMGVGGWYGNQQDVATSNVPRPLGVHGVLPSSSLHPWRTALRNGGGDEDLLRNPYPRPAGPAVADNTANQQPPPNAGASSAVAPEPPNINNNIHVEEKEHSSQLMAPATIHNDVAPPSSHQQEEQKVQQLSSVPTTCDAFGAAPFSDQLIDSFNTTATSDGTVNGTIYLEVPPKFERLPTKTPEYLEFPPGLEIQKTGGVEVSDGGDHCGEKDSIDNSYNNNAIDGTFPLEPSPAATMEPSATSPNFELQFATSKSQHSSSAKGKTTFEELDEELETFEGGNVVVEKKYGFRKQTESPRNHSIINFEALLSGKKKLSTPIMPGGITSTTYRKTKRLLKLKEDKEMNEDKDLKEDEELREEESSRAQSRDTPCNPIESSSPDGQKEATPGNSSLTERNLAVAAPLAAISPAFGKFPGINADKNQDDAIPFGDTDEEENVPKMMVEELAVERSDEIGRSGSKPEDARTRTVSTSSTGYKLTKPRSNNLLNILSSGGTLRNIPIENPFTILGSLDFHDEMKKKMKCPKSERMHPVLHRNYLRLESQILGSPILPPGVWNTRFPKIKPNKKLETPINQENVREMGVGGLSEKQQGVATECGEEKRVTTWKQSDSPSTSTGSASPRQSMEWRGKRHKRRSKRHGRGKKSTEKWKKGKWIQGETESKKKRKQEAADGRK